MFLCQLVRQARPLQGRVPVTPTLSRKHCFSFKEVPLLPVLVAATCVAAYVTAAVLVGFLLHPVHHVDPAWFAVLGAIVLCVCDAPMEVEKVVRVSRTLVIAAVKPRRFSFLLLDSYYCTW